ncbi:MAG: hypothetical protein ACLPVY_21985 [Acidimicrobiia bacterium]
MRIIGSRSYHREVLARFFQTSNQALTRSADADRYGPNIPRQPPARAIHARGAGLRRLSVVTRVFVAGSVAGAGLCSALAAWAQPGRY